MQSVSTIIIILILIVICIFAVKSYAKKLSHGCCGCGDELEKKIKPADKNKNNYPYKAIINIEGMSCENCVRRIENALNSLDGIYAAVNFKKNSAEVLFKTEPDEEKIADTIINNGYKISKIKIEKSQSSENDS